MATAFSFQRFLNWRDWLEPKRRLNNHPKVAKFSSDSQ